MGASGEQEVFCPRCGYSLRGLTVPRCPECGLIFAAGQWPAGVLREHIPTWLDRCDPWQPHQMLIRSLYELFRGALRPRWLLTKLDLNGRLLPGSLMFILGCLWLYLLTVALVASATFLHTGASPAASLRSAACGASPRILLAALVPTVLAFGLASFPNCVQMKAPSRRQLVRLAAYWIPASALYVIVPVGLALVASPDFALGGGSRAIWPLLSAIPAMIGIVGHSHHPVLRVERVRVLGRGIGIGVLWLVVGIGFWLAVLPRTLEPSLWVYF